MTRYPTATVFPPLPAGGLPLTDLQREVLALKQEKDALILAHNYQCEDIQGVADFVGDSLGLAYKAAEAKHSTIVFCGVHFMAETAKIVNPTRRVLLPDLEAGCSLADSCPADKLAALKAAQPDLYVVAYINCSAAVKALCDVIVTSGNASKIVNKVPADRPILFVPDQNLGQWVAKKTGRTMQLWPGNCYAHVQFTPGALLRAKAAHPGAPVVAHPECTEAVRDLADMVCSTELMVEWSRQQKADTLIVTTESGMIHRLRREVPHKTFVAAPTDRCACNECRFMKLNTLQKVRDCLLNGTPEITLPENIRAAAEVPLRRMLEWSR
ncbi:MAG: quinolinate synthase NadA [Verrucomicrobia bacterium]|jgi:quinolinate synthase|nr:quinolinate synthase NadA [Verrucomicrobiota bacterium]